MIKYKKITIIIALFSFLNLYNFAISQDLIIPKQKPKVSTEKKEKNKFLDENYETKINERVLMH